MKIKLLAIVLIAALFVFVGFNLFKKRVGDLSQIIVPVTKEKPVIQGKSREVYAKNLGNVRVLTFSPGGTLLASITSAGKIIALPSKKEILTGLNNPHGIAFYNGKLYVAEETKVSRYFFAENTFSAKLDKVLFSIPKGGRHFTRTIVFDKNGKMFVSIGSTCDVCIEPDPWLASVIVSDADGNNPKLFAKGLRNAVFISINPKTNELWATEMGRDWLGDNLPPDEIDIVKEGKDYGWPFCYGDRVYDKNFGQGSPDYCKNTEPPIYGIPAHSAPLGLAFQDNYLYVAYHGSWNRSIPTGYKIVRMTLDGNKVVSVEDFIEGGRPVDIVFNKQGQMFISDDRDGVIYVVK